MSPIDDDDDGGSVMNYQKPIGQQNNPSSNLWFTIFSNRLRALGKNVHDNLDLDEAYWSKTSDVSDPELEAKFEALTMANLERWSDFVSPGPPYMNCMYWKINDEKFYAILFGPLLLDNVGNVILLSSMIQQVTGDINVDLLTDYTNAYFESADYLNEYVEKMIAQIAEEEEEEDDSMP